VHATAQVVHFDAGVEREAQAWVRGTNTFLPPAVRVLWATPVGDAFHARYSALSRTYVYLLVNEPVAPAILSGKAGWFHRPLDVAAMAQAARMLLGEHDFSAFRDAQCQAKSPVRDLKEVKLERSANTLVFTFRANAYLHHMIRNIVGSLVYVGAGRQPAAWIGELLASRDRRLAAPTFAPEGLYLAGVEYDPTFELPAFRSPPRLALQSP
jgi:tRNA pseudouridine38-40 synthase